MYRVNKNGDNIPPCLTPFVTVKNDEVFRPHFTHNVCCLYQWTSNRTTTNGTFLSTLSKAFDASKKTRINWTPEPIVVGKNIFQCVNTMFRRVFFLETELIITSHNKRFNNI